MKDYLKKELLDRFGERVSFGEALREEYGRDAIHIRGRLSARLVATPDAVLFPTHPDDLVFLVRFSSRHQIPLVPRGAATSGYGGTLPVRGGIVVDFTQMKRVLAVNAEEKLVKVQPGITWKETEGTLNEYGLALRAYPSSGGLSTVGGWVASGGVGIGSYQYGPIGQNVEWVEVILPDGHQVRLSRENLALVVGTQGITGLITAIAMPVRPLQEDGVLVATFRRLRGFLQSLVDIREKRLPLWHVSLISGAVDATEEGTSVPLSAGDGLELPLTRHTALMVFPNSPPPDVSLEIRTILLTNGGVVKPAGFASTFWEDRWGPQGMGQVGPYTASGTVMLPVVKLIPVYREARKQELPVRLVAKLTSGGWLALRCIPAGNKAISEIVIKKWLRLAQTRGGRPYALDILETDRAREFLEPDLYEWLNMFKLQRDPDMLMNPGKLLAAGGHPALLRTAAAFDRFMNALRSQQEATPSVTGGRDDR